MIDISSMSSTEIITHCCVLIVTVSLLATLAITSVGHVCLSPETGSHTGVITETGYSGLIWKTHYIKAVSAQFSADETAFWTYGFNEQDLKLYEKARELQLNSTIVTVDYDCQLFRWRWDTGGACTVKDIREAIIKVK